MQSEQYALCITICCTVIYAYRGLNVKFIGCDAASTCSAVAILYMGEADLIH